MRLDVRRYAAFRELLARSSRNWRDRFQSPISELLPVLKLPNLSNQELAKIELPVGDEALNQGPHFVAIEPPERLARAFRALVRTSARNPRWRFEFA
jgi:hypothetical protein